MAKIYDQIKADNFWKLQEQKKKLGIKYLSFGYWLNRAKKDVDDIILGEPSRATTNQRKVSY